MMPMRVWLTEFRGTEPLRTRLVEPEAAPRLTALQLQHLELGLEVVVITRTGRVDVRNAQAGEQHRAGRAVGL